MNVRALSLMLLSGCSWFDWGVAPVEIPSDHWRVDLVAYAWSEDLPQNALTAHGAPTRTTDMAWSIGVLRRGERVVLVDVGTDAFAGGKMPQGRPEARGPKAWNVQWGMTLPEALAKLGLEPQDVTDVVLTHHHWDHVEGLVHLPDATVHVQRDVLAAMGEDVFAKGSVPALAARVRKLDAFDPEVHEPLEGITMRRTSVHSPGHMVVEVDCGSRNALLIGDAAYLASHVMEGVPAARSMDEEMHKKVLSRLKKTVDDGAILVAGHDPLTFQAGYVVNVCP